MRPDASGESSGRIGAGVMTGRLLAQQDPRASSHSTLDLGSRHREIGSSLGRRLDHDRLTIVEVHEMADEGAEEDRALERANETIRWGTRSACTGTALMCSGRTLSHTRCPAAGPDGDAHGPWHGRTGHRR